MVKLVRKDDIIQIKNGMNISARVPACVFDDSKPFSPEYTHAVVEVGKIYLSTPFSREKIIELLDAFISSKFNVFLSEEELKKFVNKFPVDYTVKSFNTSFLEGEYVVSEATFLEKRIMPYQVFCYKKDNPDIKIMFFQNCPVYKANISEEIEVVGNINE